MVLKKTEQQIKHALLWKQTVLDLKGKIKVIILVDKMSCFYSCTLGTNYWKRAN